MNCTIPSRHTLLCQCWSLTSHLPAVLPRTILHRFALVHFLNPTYAVLLCLTDTRTGMFSRPQLISLYFSSHLWREAYSNPDDCTHGNSSPYNIATLRNHGMASFLTSHLHLIHILIHGIHTTLTPTSWMPLFDVAIKHYEWNCSIRPK